MDEAPEKLFQELGGIRTPARQERSSQPVERQTGTLPARQDDLNRWRILLVELAYLLNASFQDVHYWEGVKAEKNTFSQFVRMLQELDQMSVHDGTIRINFRGSQTGKISEKLDYVIKFGDITVDLAGISALTRRMGLRFKHLEGRLLRAFETFGVQGIKTLILKIPAKSDHSIEIMRISLRVISCYQQAVESNSAIVFTKDGKEFSLPPILDETNQPDPNLTLVAALNGLNPELMQDLVGKVTKVIRDKNLTISGGTPANVYQAMFKMKSLQQRLIKPPLEINSDKPAAADMGPKAAGATGMPTPAGHQVAGIPADLKIDPALLKANVARLVKDAFGDSPEKAARIMKSVYGKDYNKIDSQSLGERLRLITDLLMAMQKNPKSQQAMQEVLGRIQAGMDQVPSEALDDLVTRNDDVGFWSDQGETAVGKIDENLLGIIDNAKKRSAARKKNRVVFSPDQAFETHDFEKIAEDFDLSVAQAEDIVGLFKSCFDAQGDFLRASFEKKVPDFVRHEKKVFDILWEFLKGTSRRSDRLPFLNSLQLLVKEQKKPIQAIKVLLSDFSLDPSGIEFADRNAIMLANQFLRTYNKELNMDIEITPEEVLLVKEGLDTKTANYAKWKVDGEQQQFFEKMITIRRKLLKTLDPDSSVTPLLPIRFLLALEREVHIFLALVGGQTAYAVIRGSLNVYGNPSSQVYRLKESQNYMSALLQHLAVLVRGIGRLGEKKDLSLLDDIKKKEAGFMSLGENARHAALVRRVLGWIDAAKNNINSRSRQY
jgi:hypothetical protein